MPARSKPHASGAPEPRAVPAFWERCKSIPDRAEDASERALSQFSSSLPQPAKRVLGPLLTWLGAEEPRSISKRVSRKPGDRDDARLRAKRAYSDEVPGAARDGRGAEEDEPQAATRLERLRRRWRLFLARFSKKKAKDDSEVEEIPDDAVQPRRHGSRNGGKGSRARKHDEANDDPDQPKAAAPRKLVSAPVRYLALAFIAATVGFGFRWAVEPEVPEAKVYKRALKKVERTEAKLQAMKKRQSKKVKDVRREFSEKNKAMTAAAKAQTAALEEKLAAARASRASQASQAVPAPKSANCLLSGRPEASAEALRECVMEFNRTGG